LGIIAIRATTGAIVVPPTPPSTPPADLSVVKTGSSSTGTVGQPFTYQIVATNNGPNAATKASSTGSPCGSVGYDSR
jgi:hypothetical protein